MRSPRRLEERKKCEIYFPYFFPPISSDLEDFLHLFFCVSVSPQSAPLLTLSGVQGVVEFFIVWGISQSLMVFPIHTLFNNSFVSVLLVQFSRSVVFDSLRPHESHSTPGLPVHHNSRSSPRLTPSSQ